MSVDDHHRIKIYFSAAYLIFVCDLQTCRSRRD